MRNFKNLIWAAGLLLLASCSETKKAEVQLTASGLDAKRFETESTQLIQLTNAAGMEVCVTNFGGRIVSVMVPDKDGNMQDVVLGFDSVDQYFPENNQTDFGASIGRYANRINQGRIVVDADTIQLPQNNYGHCLHGGPTGWQYQTYEVGAVTDNSVELIMNSPDGDNNFPGNVVAKVTYTLTDDNAIDIRYEATTDKKTVVNMTNHSYFNLSGNPLNTITDHVVMINADCFTPVDSTFMTTGEILPVEGTPMDFRAGKAISEDIEKTDFEQVKFGLGFDHNWVLNTKGDDTAVAVRAECPSTGIVLEVYTNEPGIQVYTGNFLDSTVTGKKGITYAYRTGICFESQKYPDSPNKNWEESQAYLEPGQKYNSHCVFKFSVKK